MSQIPEIDIYETQKRMAEGSLLIDVREQNEYDELHIPGSILLPLSELQERYSELPKDKPLIMQCRSGGRSGRATEFLLANGYEDVVNMAGGILAWSAADLETE
ncbi:MAG: rhodanese-like domain-containing protein [Trueperaceae bacterium]|nr:rhodanese-like domain-containing protein [Trueperaceae bacterium]